MSIFIISVISLVVFTILVPESVLSFLRTMREWLKQRQTKREEVSERQTVVDEATLDLITWVAKTQKQLRATLKSKTRKQLLHQLKAAGERYLQTVNQDEQPSVYRFAEKLVRDIQHTSQKDAVRDDNG